MSRGLREVVDIFRQLDQTNTAAYDGHLALGLHNLSVYFTMQLTGQSRLWPRQKKP